jgi:hypothetical protein
MGIDSGSEALRRDQRDDEIDADSECCGEAKDHFEHDGLSDSGDETRIKREKAEGADAHGEEDNIGHDEYTSVVSEAAPCVLIT